MQRDLVVLAAALICISACGSDQGTPPATPPEPPPVKAIVDLRADTNRDGVVRLDDPADDEGETTWDAKHGAILLANIDDDQHTCPKLTAEGRAIPDVDLPNCNDAADEVINGDDDLEDLARLRTAPWPDAPDDAVGTLSIAEPAADKVRLFRHDADAWTVFDPATATLDAATLRTGLELGIEAKDIVRDASAWSGYVDITFHVTAKGVDQSDAVRMRVAPVITFHHLSPAETVYTATIGDDRGSLDFRGQLAGALAASGLPKATEIANPDQWMQDYFETAYMSMPAAGGAQHVIRVFYRSANLYKEPTSPNPLRPAGRIVFTRFRGKDVAGIQAFDPKTPPSMESLNSFGNTETIPPYTLGSASYPLGRLLRGNIPKFHVDKTLSTIFESQMVQPPVYLDTSWLLVGHVDETLSFLPSGNARGWIMLANDARLAKKMLEEQVAKGNGGVKMFVGQNWLLDDGTESVAEKSIADVLADTAIMNESAKAATEVDAQLEILKTETGITDAEIVRVPFLHQPVSGGSLAYQPGTVNSLVPKAGHFIAPDPHGPLIDGKDIMKVQLEDALKPFGVAVHWVEDWDLYHRLSGEVHCGTNAMRAIPEVRWWETGR